MQLSDVELEILGSVIGAFMDQNAATKRKELVLKFRNITAIDRLIHLQLLRELDSERNLAPSTYAIEHAGDSENKMRARVGLEITIRALQQIYEIVPDRKQITRNDVLTQVISERGDVAPHIVDRGLYFIQEFGVLDSYGPEPGPTRERLFNLHWMVISERVVALDSKSAWTSHTQRHLASFGLLTEGDGRPRHQAGTHVNANVRTGYEWDVFISHASEDKVDIARPLAHALIEQGLLVWYDEFSLKLGDRLRQSIDKGLSNSRFGVVILSRHFFQKHWPQTELDGLATLEIDGKLMILPLWHRIGFEEVKAFSPTLADRLAVSTDKGMSEVVKQIMAAIR